MTFWRRWLGTRGERLAARHLRAAGWRVLARNFTAVGGEVDLVVTDGATVAYVEVKTRAAHAEHLHASVPPSKQRRIARAAEAYATARGLTDRPGRFDVVLVDDSGPEPTVEWLQGAFESAFTS